MVWLLTASVMTAACRDDASSTDAADAHGDASADVDALSDIVEDSDGTVVDVIDGDTDVSADGAVDGGLDVDDVDADMSADGAVDAGLDVDDDVSADGAVDAGLDVDADGTDAAEGALDADSDGIPDGSDVCPGSDDTVDLNGDDVPDCTQNVLPNGGFDGTIEPWHGADYAPSRDANEMAASGSAQLTFIEGGPFVPRVAQCLAVEPGRYGMYAQTFVASGQDTEADTRFLVQAYPGELCDVRDGFVELINRVMDTPTDAWTTLSGEITVTPERPRLAVWVVLEPAANDDVEGFVDNVLLVSEDAAGD